MRKSFTYLILKLAAFSVISLFYPQCAFAQQQILQLTVNPSTITLMNGTQRIDLTITIDVKTFEREVDKMILYLHVPTILSDKIDVEVYKNDKSVKRESLDKLNTIVFYFILEDAIEIKKTKTLHYSLYFTFKNIDCIIISQLISNKYELQAYAKLLLNEIETEKVGLHIVVDPDVFWNSCFSQALNLSALGRLEKEHLYLDLTISVYDSRAVERIPPFEFRIRVEGAEITGCVPQAQKIACRLEDGVALLQSSELLPNRFNLTLKLPGEAIKRGLLEVLMDYKGLRRSVALAPRLYVRDRRFAQGVLYLTLGNSGTLPYNASIYRVTPESAVKVHLVSGVVVNPSEERQIGYNITIIGSRSLTNQLKVALNLNGFINESIVFATVLSGPKIELFNGNRIRLFLMFSGNESLRLEIPERSPLRLSFEGISVISCDASGLQCRSNNSEVLVYGVLVLPSNISLNLEVRDKGGPANRRIEVVLSDELRSEVYVRIGSEPEKKFDRLLIPSFVIIVALAVLAVVIVSKKRWREAPQELHPRQIEEEVYFDLG